ncbi:MAG: carbamoyl-phosphate synthase large subunit, partial [Clostridiales bacterium]|nr:carbamoyl-phosphate synthase large subunit [Clostridiales bacterium]
MPHDASIQKVLVIGSGPIVIGQAAEFDYAGTQACRALQEEGVEVVLINSNPATIMTDSAMAGTIYIEPLTLTTLKRVIEKEKPDSILSTLGGQTGLTLSMRLAKEGFLKKHGVRLLGADPETIDKAEDRQLFKDTMEAIGQPVVPSLVVHNVEDALRFASEITYPVIVRPAYTLGGSGGGIADDAAALARIASNGLHLSPIGQILVEKSIAGWKEIEFEVMRDGAGNVITVCSMENIDPVGIHTGDSIVIAPALTLSDKEYQMLRTASLSIITALAVEGGCNCQFALHPDTFEYAVIEVNPRVSRSSALASKATGYPIAKVAAKIAIGYRLDEIQNAITKKTYACFEPTLDYVALKFPKWPFDKFAYSKRLLGTQMQATGEVMTIADRFEAALMKAVRGAEVSLDSLNMPKLKEMDDDEVYRRLSAQTDERIFVVFEALLRGVSCEAIHSITGIDRYFLEKMKGMAAYEHELLAARQDEKAKNPLSEELYVQGKKFGYPDRVITRISGRPVPFARRASYKMVDTCGGEFAAETPYFYSTWDERDEAAAFIDKGPGARRRVIVLGSGPIRIGQGIEFDYSSVHCAWALRKLGYDVVIINNNPETVSTDFDTADRLYFEPLTPEDVLDIIRIEEPFGVVVAFGGQTAIGLTKFLHEQKVPILGTSADGIDMAEDRERFEALLESLSIKRPKGTAVADLAQAERVAGELGYPVLIRPSYVLGGQNMTIAFGVEDIREYMAIIRRMDPVNPVLIDKYLQGIEIEVDAICDGGEILIPGVMEHVERTGIHSGDSIALYPAIHVQDDMTEKIIETTRRLSLSLKICGLVNIQYIIYHNDLYVIEVNPRASRTVPYISKVTGVPMAELATRAMLGEPLADMGYGTGLYRTSPYIVAKVPVFSFEKLDDVDTQLGPEMKSTGETLGIGKTPQEALYKGLIAAGYAMKKSGGVFLTVRDSDKNEILDIARKFAELSFSLYATFGTAQVLQKAGLAVTVVGKIHESHENSMTLLESGKVQYIISTSAKGRDPALDSVKIRRKAVALGIPCLTSIDTANAVADSIKSRYSEINTELVNLNDMRTERMKLNFTKMQACGNDYLYINCLESEVFTPESLAVALSDRHYGVGGDGIVLILPSGAADAKMRVFNLDGS